MAEVGTIRTKMMMYFFLVLFMLYIFLKSIKNVSKTLAIFNVWCTVQIEAPTGALGIRLFIRLFKIRLNSPSLDPSGTPGPPRPPWCPPYPRYVILGHSQSSWVIRGHIWPISREWIIEAFTLQYNALHCGALHNVLFVQYLLLATEQVGSYIL